MKRGLQLLLALAVLAGGALLARFVLANPRESERVEQPASAPVVEVREVQRGDHRLRVRSHGEVRPSREAELSSEVPGRVVELGERFRVGAFLDAGELLLRLDDRDLAQALAEARAAVTAAELRVATERHEAEVARDEWERFGEGPADPLLLREPQLADARAALEAARARVARAERDLARTELRAPFAARVAERHAELGECVAVGEVLARLMGTERAEVRLPVRDEELAALELGLGEAGTPGTPVELHATLAGRRWTWPARVVRSEGRIDPRTRMVTLIAEVEDPYGRAGDSPPGRPPLLAGLFVEAQILGRQLRDVFVIPRVALRDGSRVSVVEDGERLRVREVDPLFLDDQVAVLDAGLQAGELLALTQLEIVVDGMAVRLAEDAPSAADAAPDGRAADADTDTADPDTAGAEPGS